MSRVEPNPDFQPERRAQPRRPPQVDDRHPSKAEGDEQDVEQALERQEKE